MVSAFWTIATRWWPQAVPSQTFNLNFMLQGYGKEVKTWRNVIGQKVRRGDIKMNIVPAPGHSETADFYAVWDWSGGHGT